MDGQIWRYKGIGPFRDVDLDHQTFFGRNRDARSLLGLVESERLVVLFAKSGIGKTSIINAALLEALRKRGYFPVVARLNQDSSDLFRGVLDTIAVAAKERGVDCTSSSTDEWRFFKDAEFWSEADNEQLRPVLILDQFEELFTLHSFNERRTFAARLGDLIRGRRTEPQETRPADAAAAQAEPLPPDLKIVLSLREDFLAHLDELGIPGILRNRLRLSALTKVAAREAIVGPAAVAAGSYVSKPFIFDDKATDAIIEFLSQQRRGDVSVVGDEIEPSQVQLICQYVEEQVKRRQDAGSADDGPITVTERDLGGESRMRSILEGFYERTLGAIKSGAEARKIRRLCERRLVSSSGRRLTEDEDEICAKFGVSKESLQHLVDARLLRAEPRLGGVYYELSHDSLIAPIVEARRKRSRATRRVAAMAATVTASVLTGVLAVFLTSVQEANRSKTEKAARLVLFEHLKQDNLDVIVNAVEQLTRDHGLATSEILAFMDQSRIVDMLVTSGSDTAACESFRRRLSTLPGPFLGSPLILGAALSAADDLARRCPEARAQGEALARTLRERFVGAHPELQQPSWEADEVLNRRIRIEGGTFLMGSPRAMGDEDEHPQHRVQLSGFHIQQHEVTNDEYRRFDPARAFPAARSRHPVVDLTWYEALAYAVWVGGELPTEAQWEYTARGTTGRDYPWGNDPPGRREQYYPGFGETVPVAEHPDAATPEGVHDLAGNISEWCRDWYGAYLAEPGTDPTGPASGQRRVVRGNSIYAPALPRPAAARDKNYPAITSTNVGFRVVFSRQ